MLLLLWLCILLIIAKIVILSGFVFILQRTEDEGLLLMSVLLFLSNTAPTYEVYWLALCGFEPGVVEPDSLDPDGKSYSLD